jgi:Rrf2 family nitric oxide-sensitive transcriptional repressor
MQLAKFTDYALRVLMHLAAAQGFTLTTRQIADIHDAKFNHLSKVTYWLKEEGYVSARRGRNGGLQLAKPADQINIGAIVRKIERQYALVECVAADGGQCKLGAICALKQALLEAQEAFYQVLDQQTLASLTQAETALTRFLTRVNKEAAIEAS